jgi:hypothetical protein
MLSIVVEPVPRTASFRDAACGGSRQGPGHLIGQRVMRRKSKQLIGVILGTAAVTLFAAQSSGLLGGGSPLLVSPSSFPFSVLRLIGIPPWLIPLLWDTLFVGWHPALLRGEAEVPARTIALWLATALLSGAYFVVSWRAGVVFEGRLFTELSLTADLVVFSVCSALLRLARTRPSFGRSLGLQVSLFVWVSTYAFPYLGSGVLG